MAFQAVKRKFQNLEDFLDNLPSSPCPERPEGGRYCTICMRVNGPVASDCEYVETSDDGGIEEGSTFKILGGGSGEDRPRFNIVGEGGAGPSAEETQRPIAGIEKEYPLIEIVKPEEPSVRPLEMEIIEEETVVFEIADDEEVEQQEVEEELTTIIIQVQPLLGKAAELGLDTSVIQDKIKEGMTFLSEKDYEKAGTLLKGIDSAVMMDSILYTQNKLEEVVAKKPGEKTLPRYFAEAGNRFKKKDYLKCLDYLKYVVEQSTKMLKQLEELEKAKKELEEEEEDAEEVFAVVALADDDDDDDEGEIKIKVKSFKPKKKGKKVKKKVKGVKKAKVKGVKKAKGGKKAKPKQAKAKGVKKAKPKQAKAKGVKKAKPKQAKAKGVKKAKTPPKLAKPKAPKEAKIRKRQLKEVPKFKPLTEKKPTKEKKQKPLKVKEPAAKKSKKKSKAEEVWELEPLDKTPDLRLKALLAAQKAAETYTEKKDAGEDVAEAEKLISKARELLAKEKYEEMIILSNQALELME